MEKEILRAARCHTISDYVRIISLFFCDPRLYEWQRVSAQVAACLSLFLFSIYNPGLVKDHRFATTACWSRIIKKIKKEERDSESSFSFVIPRTHILWPFMVSVAQFSGTKKKETTHSSRIHCLALIMMSHYVVTFGQARLMN